MKSLRNTAYKALRKSESFFKTDMVYLSKGSLWTTLRFTIGLFISVGTIIAFGNLIPKETYGTYSYILSLAGSLSFLTLSGMSTGIIRAVTGGKEYILPVAIKMQMRFNSLATISIFIMSFYYGIRGNTAFAVSLALLSIAVPLSAVYHSFESVLIGKKKFDTLTIITSAISLAAALGTIITLVLTDNVVTIIFVYCLLSLVPNYLAYRFVSHDLTKDKPETQDIDELKRTAVHLTGAGVISTVAQYFDKIILFQVAGPAALAVYGFAIAGPEKLKGLIKNWVIIALPKLASRTINDINSVFYRRLGLAMLTGVVLSILFIVLSPILFKLLLPQYLDSIIYSQVYSLGLIFIPISVFIGNIFHGQNMLRAVYISSIGSQLLRIILFLVLGWKWQIWGLVIASIVSYFASALYNILIWSYESSRLLRKNVY